MTRQLFPNKILLICVTRGFILHKKLHHFSRVGNWTVWSPAPRTPSGAILRLGLTGQLPSSGTAAAGAEVVCLSVLLCIFPLKFLHCSLVNTTRDRLCGLMLPANLFWLDPDTGPSGGGGRDPAAMRDGDVRQGTPLIEELQVRREEVSCLRGSTQFCSCSVFWLKMAREEGRISCWCLARWAIFVVSGVHLGNLHRCLLLPQW